MKLYTKLFHWFIELFRGPTCIGYNRPIHRPHRYFTIDMENDMCLLCQTTKFLREYDPK